MIYVLVKQVEKVKEINMNLAEKNFWSSIQTYFQGHVQRLESSTGAGVPDVNICWMGREYWLELKVVTPRTGILIRREQWAWHNRRMNSGGKCFLLALDEKMNACFFAPTFIVNVEPYGKANKYVLVSNPEALANIHKPALREFLKINLFTIASS